MPVITQCTIKEISRKATYSRDGLTVTRVLDVYPFKQAAPLAYEMLGGPRYINNRIFRRLPERDPWLPQCFVENIETEGMGRFYGFDGSAYTPTAVLANQAEYDFARMTVTYKTPEKATPEEKEAASEDEGNEASEIELASQTFDFSAQSLTLPLSQLKFKYGAAGGTSMIQGVNGTKVMPRIDYALQRHEVARRPLVAITSLLGRINKNPFNLGVAIWPAETLRFEGANISQKVTSDGFKFFDINYKFCIQPVYDLCATSTEAVDSAGKIITPSTTALKFVGWNRIYRPDRGYWDTLNEVKTPTRGIYNYDTDVVQAGIATGFNLLFNPRAT